MPVESVMLSRNFENNFNVRRTKLLVQKIDKSREISKKTGKLGNILISR